LDLTPVVIWWLTISIFGLVGWLVAFSLLRNLPDRGFAFARPLGLLLTGYILWLGGTFRLLQNSVGGSLVALVLALVIGLIWLRQQRSPGSLSMLAWLRREWRYALSVELLYHVAFAGWVLFKAYNPNIETTGGEKWMEIAFINGTLRSDYFPPQDPWLSGFGISYYYFGYVFMAMVTRLTGLISTIAFNLYIPTLFAMTLTAAFGLIANLVSLHQNLTQISDPRSPIPNPKTQISHPTSQISHPTSPIPNLLSPAILTGAIGALFVAVLGNLEGLLEVLHKRGLFTERFWIWLDIRDLKIPPVDTGTGWVPDRFIWWWRGSRVLTDYTLTGQEQEVIDEFPFFSFLLGDVHPHVLALPFVLLVIALALNLLANRRSALRPGEASNEAPAAASPSKASASEQTGSSFSNVINDFIENLQHSWHELIEATGGRLAFGLYAVALGGLSFLNTWDFPIYLSVVGLALIARLSRRWGGLQNALGPGVIGTGILGVTGVILYLPFYATFQSQARGILPNLWNPTRLVHFFVFFGPFLVATIFLLIVLSRQELGWRKHLGWSLVLTILGPVLVMLLALTTIVISPAGQAYVQGILNNQEVQQLLGDPSIGALLQESLWRRLVHPWTFLLLGGLLGWVLALALSLSEANGGLTPAGNHPDHFVAQKFVIILLLVGLGLPLTVEFIFLRDNFGIRMNTVFKFYFQAWVLLALASAFAVYYVSRNLRGAPALAWQVSLVGLVAGGLVYPILATLDKANYFRNKPTLDGIEWVSENRPGDYAAIEWLRENAPDQAVILEAPGASYAAYQYTGRISAMTGLPTLLGWGGHESQWRGNYEEPARREPDIDTLYNTIDLQRAQMLLDKYNITYVLVGPLERERYTPSGLNKFVGLMEIAFQADDVTIYRRR
jgi:uncharacterized membrane protein